MKRYSSFKKPTYAEAMAKKREAEERRAAKPKVKKNPTEYTTLKRKLWAIFSKYIRRKYANRDGMVITCDGVYLHWKETHCGHLLPNTERSSNLGGNALWYYENNFYPQSANGNYFNANGSAGKYMEFAIRKYGPEEIEKMRKLKQTVKRWTVTELEDLYKHYKEEFDKIDI